jgi:hypothetical protein
MIKGPGWNFMPEPRAEKGKVYRRFQSDALIYPFIFPCQHFKTSFFAEALSARRLKRGHIYCRDKIS